MSNSCHKKMLLESLTIPSIWPVASHSQSLSVCGEYFTKYCCHILTHSSQKAKEELNFEHHYHDKIKFHVPLCVMNSYLSIYSFILIFLRKRTQPSLASFLPFLTIPQILALGSWQIQRNLILWPPSGLNLLFKLSELL